MPDDGDVAALLQEVQATIDRSESLLPRTDRHGGFRTQVRCVRVALRVQQLRTAVGGLAVSGLANGTTPTEEQQQAFSRPISPTEPVSPPPQLLQPLGGFRRLQKTPRGSFGSPPVSVCVDSPRRTSPDASMVYVGAPDLCMDASMRLPSPYHNSGELSTDQVRVLSRRAWSREAMLEVVVQSGCNPVPDDCIPNLVVAGASAAAANFLTVADLPHDLHVLAGATACAVASRVLPLENIWQVPLVGCAVALQAHFEGLLRRKPGVLCLDWYPGIADRAGFGPEGTLFTLTGEAETAHALLQLSAKGWWLVSIASVADQTQRKYDMVLSRYAIRLAANAHSQLVAHVMLDVSAEMLLQANAEGCTRQAWVAAVSQSLSPTVRKSADTQPAVWKEALARCKKGASHSRGFASADFDSRFAGGAYEAIDRRPADAEWLSVVQWLLGVSTLPSSRLPENSTTPVSAAGSNSPGQSCADSSVGSDSRTPPTPKGHLSQTMPVSSSGFLATELLTLPAVSVPVTLPEPRKAPLSIEPDLGLSMRSRKGAEFVFGDFVVPVDSGQDGGAGGDSSAAESLFMSDIADAADFQFGDFRAVSSFDPGPSAAMGMAIGLEYEEREMETEPEKEKTFAFSDFSVPTETDLDAGIALSYFRDRGVDTDDSTFMFGDFCVAVVDRGSELTARSKTSETQRQREGTGVCLAVKSVSPAHDASRLRGYTVTSLLGHSNRVKGIAVHKTEELYASCSNTDRIVFVHSLPEGKEIQSYIGHQDVITSVSFSADGKLIATTSRDATAKIWDSSTAREVNSFQHPKVVICSTFSQNAQYVVTGCQDWQCRLFRVKERKAGVICVFREHLGIVTNVCFEPRGEHVASASADTSLKVWSAASGQCTLNLAGHTGVILSVRYSLDAKYILSNDTREVRVWNALNGICTWLCCVSSKPTGGRTKAVSWSLSCFAPGAFGQRYLVVAANDSTVQVMDFQQPPGEPFLTLKMRAPVFALQSGVRNTILAGDFLGNVYSIRCK